ncbi:DUF2929 family protein [Sporosarcina sp. UB5]|uniref:DUF2929 family protein n=1 Tax=Sporosarcina sp. UB5 TaxID=3047463 RepID=UPI003D7BC8ED
MKYILTFVWSFLLVAMVNYVAGSIGAIQSFDFMSGVIASIVMAVLIICITAVTPDGEVADY